MASTPTVYFAGAIRGDRIAADTMHTLIDYISSLGYKVLTEHIKAEKPSDAKLTAEEIEKRDIAWIDDATHIIAEISGASTGTGREIEYARVKDNFGKVRASILCIYHKEREFYASPMVRGMTPDRYPNVEVASYENPDDAKTLVSEFLKR